MQPPQTERQPLKLRHSEQRKLLEQPLPQDQFDLYATDANAEIRNLGLLTLRRGDVNNWFALGDLCAKQSITEDNRLLVFYVGKCLKAYERARTEAANSVDRTLAATAIGDYINWLVTVATEHPNQRNIATMMWALAEEDSANSSITIDQDQLVDLIDRYIGLSFKTREGIATSEHYPSSTDHTTDNGHISTHESKTLVINDDADDDSALELTQADDSRPTNHNPPDSDETRMDFRIRSTASRAVLPPILSAEASIEQMTAVDESVGDEYLSSPDEEPDPEALDTIAAEVDMHESRAGLERLVAPYRRRIRMQPVLENEFNVGDRIDARYEVAEVKRGGMGIVYLCYDHQDREPVAIKSFQSRFLDNPRAVRRFTHEAVTWVRLDKHSHIVQARLVQTITNRPHIILEHVSGPEGLGADLRSWIDQKRIDVARAMEFGLHIATGMQHAQMMIPGLVHRDLKPANILVTHEGMAKVTDFGLVRSLELDGDSGMFEDEQTTLDDNAAVERLTRVGAIVGTAPYMSPEQCRSEDVDLRSDIYAFGALLYEMLTGKHLYNVRKWKQWIYAHLNNTPDFDERYHETIPESLRTLVLRCVDKAPEQRPQTWSAIVDRLSAIYETYTGEPAVLEVSGPQLELQDLMNKGYSLTELGRYEESIAAYDRAITLHDNEAWIWARRGRTLRLWNRLEDAIASYDKALELKPTYAWAHNGKGIVLDKIGELDSALDAFKEATTLKPNEIWHWYNQADTLFKMGLHHDAIVAMKAGLDIDPTHAPSWAKLGQIQRQLRNYADAVEAYRETVKYDPEYAWAWNGYGLALRALGRAEEALECFRTAANLQPDDVWHWYNMTEILVETKRYEEALEPAINSTEASADHVFSWAKLGQVLRYNGQYAEALEAYNRALVLAPTYAWAYNGRGIVLEHLERYDEALDDYQKAAEISPMDTWSRYNLGNLLVNMEQYENALEMLQQVITLNPRHVRSRARIGSLLIKMERYVEALEALDDALQIDPGYAWA